MRTVSKILLLIGLLISIGAIALLVKNVWDLRILYQIAMANKSQPSVIDPTNMVLIGAGLALLGGLFFGIGMGMPKKTAGTVRDENIASYKVEQIAATKKAEEDAAKQAAKDAGRENRLR